MASNSNKDLLKQVEELKTKEIFLEAINSFALVLFEAKTIDDIVWSVAKQAISRLNYEDCVVYLLDEERNLLVQKAAFGPKNPEKFEIKDPILIAPGKGIVGKVFSEGKAIVVKDTTKYPDYIVDDDVRLSEIAVPIMSNNKVIGVIDSEHSEKGFYGDQDLLLLTTIAAMVSTKIEQARATEALEQYKENLERLVEDKTLELEQANDRLLKKNKEKETLIQEIHHRVKNNMQIMISLLNLQMSSSESEREMATLRDFQDRIRSMAIIHERLYQDQDMSHVSINQYVYELSRSLVSSYDLKKEVILKIDVDKVKFDLDTSIPIGLIINELITNSLKHAFTKEERPFISISIKQTKKHFEFHYKDNGPGFEMDTKKDESFGINMIEVLCDQLGGEASFSTQGKFGFEVSFIPKEAKFENPI